MIRPIYYTTSPQKQFLILIFVLLASFVLFAIVSSIGMIAFPKNLDNNTYPIEYTQYLLVVQGIIGMIFPALLFTFLTNLRPWHSIGVQPIKPLWWVPLAIVITLSVQPLVELLGVWNAHLELPKSLAMLEMWMKESEDTANAVLAQILQGMHIKNIIANIFIIAVIPAIGEELIFRGAIQKVLGQWWRNPHLAILFTAFLFSAIHFQFFGFLPRFVLGLLLGYLFYWSKNIWVSILVHFLNNLMGLSLYYYYLTYQTIENPLQMQNTTSIPVEILGVSLVVLCISLFLSYLLYKSRKKRMVAQNVKLD